MAKPFQALIEGLQGTVHGDAKVEISGITFHSKKVEPGFLFAAIVGSQLDGHNFLPEALQRGAVACLVEHPPAVAFPASFQVPSVRFALGAVSRKFYDDPMSQLLSVAVTGTKGKTTTVILLATILNAQGIPTAWMGTLGVSFSDWSFQMENTTPESSEFLKIGSFLLSKGCRAIIFEASSHALKLGKLSGAAIDRSIFTNLSHDHLDFHPDLEDYFLSKRRLFMLDEAEKIGICVKPGFQGLVNVDDEYGMRLWRESKNLLGFGIRSGDFRAEDIQLHTQGFTFRLVSDYHDPIEITSSLLGEPNIYNVLSASATALTLGIGAEAICSGVQQVQSLPGRMERIAQKPFRVFVDYAHTPDSLFRTLAAIEQTFGAEKGKLITVWGCGGDRDRVKRGKMGKIASEFSSFSIITNDNPRSEDPEHIFRDILSGISIEHAGNIRIIPDRYQAIEYALRSAQTGDIVLIAGKGHETIQVLKDRTIPFDDRTVAREILQKLGYAT